MGDSSNINIDHNNVESTASYSKTHQDRSSPKSEKKLSLAKSLHEVFHPHDKNGGT
jgi:hypothetical protein